MRSKTTRRFRELLASLPEQVQRQAQDRYELFRDSRFHPGLHVKPISPSDPTIYSVRVGLRHRAIGIRQDNDILWIGSQADYDRQIERF